MTLSARLALFLCIIVPLTVVILAARRGTNGTIPEKVWGGRGVMPGEFVRPRAATIIGDSLFIVDFTARVQKYTLDGEHAHVTFTTPDFRNGRPSGLGFDREGNLIVADSHYHRIRIYDLDGRELRSFGGKPGKEPGQFGYISDCVQDDDGNYYVSEFGETDRITKLDANGQFLTCWGNNGTEPGQFERVRALALGPDGLLYAADACNHRIQVFERDGKLVRVIGHSGTAVGEFAYPYDVACDPQGFLYVVERGNCRVQKLTREGKPVSSWGRPGKKPGELADPWAIAVDRRGRVHVVDTENHRVQIVNLN